MMEEAEARRARSIACLQEEGVAVLPSLPLIHTEATSVRRTTAEIVARTVALTIAAVKGETHDIGDDDVMDFTAELIERFSAGDDFTPAERRFIDDPTPDNVTITQFTWRYECSWTLLWALGFVKDFGPPASICDAGAVVGPLRELGRDGLLGDATLRPQSDLLDEADLIYRFHWAVVDARLKGETVPGVDGGVVMERHYALNWLIGADPEAEWDDVSTDT